MTLSKNLFAAVATAALASFASAQYSTSVIPAAFNDISGTGTDLGIAVDDGGVVTPIGFTFNFFGSAITQIGVSSNGYMTDGGSLSDFTNDCIPTTATPNGRISPFQGDFAPNNGGNIYSQISGAPGNQTITVQWNAVPNFGSAATTSAFTFQATLFEADSSIEFQYGTFVAGVNNEPIDGSEQTIGVESQDGLLGVEISCNAAVDTTVGYRLVPSPFLAPTFNAPSSGCLNDFITLTGTGEPGHLYAIAGSTSQGPSPFLLGNTLDLGLDYLNNVLGIGLINASGDAGPVNVFIPGSFPCGFTAYTQMVTLTLGPIDNIQIAPNQATTFGNCQTFTGTLDAVNSTSDHYSFVATAGDVISITMCRLENAPGSGCSTLDPRVCVYDAPGFVGTGIVNADDNLGDCFVPGCPGTNYFGAAGIFDYTIPASGTYEIAASGWTGTSGPYELTILGCSGTVTLVADEAAGGCF